MIPSIPRRRYICDTLIMMRKLFIFATFLLSQFTNAQNYAISFDGVNDYVDIPSNIYGSTATDFTIECWIKPNSGSFNSAYHAVVGYQQVGGATSDRNPGMWINNGTVHYDMYQPSTNTRYTGNSTILVTQDKWNHLAMVKSGTNLKLYINGKLDVNTTVSATVKVPGNYRVGFNDNYFSGLVDEVRFWNTARTQQQILDFLYRSPAFNATGLLAYYKFNNGTGTTATNLCTNTSSINATLTNGPTWSSSPSVAFNPNSIRLGASTDYLQADITSAASNTITLECWVKFNTINVQQNFLGMYQALNASTYTRLIPYITSANKVDLYMANASSSASYTTSSYTISAGTWYHMAFVYDNQKSYVYVNGVLQSSNTSTVAYSMDGTDVLVVGCDRSGGNQGFDSDITLDELRIWNTARTATQIAENMDKYVAPTTSGMIAYYNFDQGNPGSTNTDLNQVFNQLNTGNLVPVNVSLTSTTSNLVAQSTNIGSRFIWNGNTSTAFNTTSNWAEDLAPATGSHVEIISSPVNNPVLDQSRTLGDLILPSGTSLNLNNFTLTLDGKLTGTGTLKAGGTSSLTFTGDYASATLYLDQTTNKTTNSLQNLTVQLGYSGVLTLGNATHITNLLKLDWGGLATGGNLTLRSTASGTAMTSNFTDATITGNVVVERYVPGRRAFRLISSPVSTTNTIYDNWQEGGSSASGFGTHITGSTTGSNGFDATISGNPSLFTFNNSTAAWSAVSSTNNSTNDKITAGTPYRLMIRGDRTISLSATSPSATATTLRTTGTLFTGSKVFSGLNTTAGAFNLVGNPYMAAVDMNALLGNATYNTNLNTVYYYIWDPTVGTRGAYVTVDVTANSNNVSGSAANKFLQPWQACFVKTKAAGAASFTFAEAAKNTTTSATWKWSFDIPLMNINLFQKDSLLHKAMPLDGLQVRFSDKYTSDLDDYDAEKPWNQDENLSVLLKGTKLSIESRANPEAIDTIQLYLEQERHQDYTFVFEPSNAGSLELELYDNYLKKAVALSGDVKSQYTFSVDAAVAASAAADRFSLRAKMGNAAVGTINPSQLLEVWPNPVSDWVGIKAKGLMKGNAIRVFDASGKCIKTMQVGENGMLGVGGQYYLGDIATGMYWIEVELNNHQTLRTQFLKAGE